MYFTKKYFRLYCLKYKTFIDKLNKVENEKDILSSSYASLERYEFINSFLLDNNMLNKKLNIIDFGCYIGLYIKFLRSIGINNSFGIDYSKKSIIFGKKIGIEGLYHGDICKGIDLYNKRLTIDFISCLHIFEYRYIEKNGEIFIYDTLKSSL